MLDHKMDTTENVQKYIDFDKDASTSPDAMISEIVCKRNKRETGWNIFRLEERKWFGAGTKQASD